MFNIDEVEEFRRREANEADAAARMAAEDRFREPTDEEVKSVLAMRKRAENEKGSK